MLANAKLALIAAVATALLASSAVARPYHRGYAGGWQDSPSYTGGGSIGYNAQQQYSGY